MNKLLSVILAVVVWGIAAGNANAQSSEIGIIIGEPTGLSAKFWTGSRTAAGLGVAWSFSGSGSIHLHSDYLLHLWFQSGTTFYLGLGGGPPNYWIQRIQKL